jgi:hypothetical protein
MPQIQPHNMMAIKMAGIGPETRRVVSGRHIASSHFRRRAEQTPT